MPGLDHQSDAAQCGIIADGRIPFTGRILYQIIEDKTCGKDSVAISQTELGAMMNLCRRQINRLVGFLRKMGYIVLRRVRRGPAEYRLIQKKPVVSALATAAINALSVRTAPVISAPLSSVPATAPVIAAEDTSLYSGIVYHRSGERPGPILMGKIREVERRYDLPEEVMCRWLEEKCNELKARMGGRPFAGILVKALDEDLPGWLKRNADKLAAIFRQRDLDRERLKYAMNS